jgi:predicted metal-dependent phosphotriesterase family hydrolase
MMGSDDTVMQLQAIKSSKPPMYVAKNGQVVPEAKAVIAVIKQKNLSMTTGHNSFADAMLLIREAIAQGINPERLSVTHANYTPAPALTVAEMTQIAALGAFVELCSSTQRAFTPEQQKDLDTKNNTLADAIKQVGAEHVIMETDVGQVGNEWHPDALAAFVRNMRARGISAADTDKMTKDNPAKFLAIPPPSAMTHLQ